MRRWLRTLACVIAVTAVADGASAPAQADTPEAGSTLSLCYSEFLPYSRTVDGQALGISPDILREAAERAGISLSMAEVPWARCLAEAEQGVFDGIMDGSARDGVFVHGRNTFLYYVTTLWVRETSPLTLYEGFGPVEGQFLGAIAGYEYPGPASAHLAERDPDTLHRARNETALLQLLIRERVDVALGDIVTFKHIADRDGMAVRYLTPVIHAHPLYFQVRPDKADLLARMDLEIARMLLDGTIDAIYRRHIGVSFSDLPIQDQLRHR